MATEPSFAQSQQIDALPVPNLPLLRKVLDHIDAHPEEWNQSHFVHQEECGTTYCVAGLVAVWAHGPNFQDLGISAEAAGAEELGLTADEARDMFYNTLDGDEMTTVPDCPDLSVRERVQVVAEGIAARAGERL